MRFIPRELSETRDISRGKSHWIDRLKLFAGAVLSLTAAYILLGLLAGALAANISEDLEARLFGWLDPPDVLKATGSRVDHERAQAVFDRLLASSDLRPLPYELHVVELPDPNAFALPGGAVVVTTALLDEVQSDAQLALVLGHELGHHQYRHALDRMGRQLLLEVSLGMLMGNVGGSSLLEGSAQLAEAGHSRDQEREADTFGLNLVHHIYGTTQDSVDFFELIFEQSESGIGSWGSLAASHPPTHERVACLRAQAAELERGHATPP